MPRRPRTGLPLSLDRVVIHHALVSASYAVRGWMKRLGGNHIGSIAAHGLGMHNPKDGHRLPTGSGLSDVPAGEETMSKASRTNKPLDQLTAEELDAAAARNERLVAMHELLGFEDRYGEYRTMRLVAVGLRAMAGARRHNPDAEWSWIVETTRAAVASAVEQLRPACAS